jgi:hypothetical protein
MCKILYNISLMHDHFIAIGAINYIQPKKEQQQ